MKRGEWIGIAALAAIATGVACASVWVLTAHGRIEAYFAGSLVLLGLAQMLTTLAQRAQSLGLTARLYELAGSSRQQGQKLSDLTRQFREAQTAELQPQNKSEAPPGEVQALRTNLRNLNERRTGPVLSRPELRQHRSATVPREDAQPAPGLERLEFLLEPIVDL